MKGFHYALIVLMAGLVVTGCGHTDTAEESAAVESAEEAIEAAEEALEDALEQAEEAVEAAEETAEEAIEAAEEKAEEAIEAAEEALEDAVEEVEEAVTGEEETDTLEETAEADAEVKSEVVYTEFTEETFEELKNSGEAFALTFHADWCPTCVKADKEIMGLEAPLPGSVLKVDYDTATELKQQYGVTKQHTAVFFDADGNTKTMPGFTVADLQNNL